MRKLMVALLACMVACSQVLGLGDLTDRDTTSPAGPDASEDGTVVTPLGDASGDATTDANDAAEGTDAPADVLISCDGGLAACGGQCVDPNVDGNCGGCGVKCGTGMACSNRKCIAPSVGCSDGSREAFVDQATFPGVAGCRGGYPASSLRTPKTGAVCGEGFAVCTVPADLCATDWHICGIPPYGPSDVSERITQTQCASESGEFVIALGNATCEPCGQVGGQGASCCGNQCIGGSQAGDCIWPGGTSWAGVVDGVVGWCGDIKNDYPAQFGVLCCHD